MSDNNTREFPFNFGAGGYSSRGLGHTYDLQASIDVLSPQEDVIKDCPTYVIGYGQNIQIIQGKCIYTGFRELGGLLNVLLEQDQKDLGGSIIPIGYSIEGSSDLPASLSTVFPKDLPASIGFMWAKELGATIGMHQPVDLSAYLKVWPQQDLPAQARGWDSKDLSASVDFRYTKDLGAILRPYKWNNLTGIARGWGQGYKDLGAALGVFQKKDLPALIRATYIDNLSAYMFAIAPKNLGAIIQGWQELDLPTIITGDDHPYNLPASIFASGGYINLSSFIKTLKGSGTYDLRATIQYYRHRDLGASLYSPPYYDLGALIDTQRLYSDLGAAIYPKMVRMTAIINVATMSSRNLAGIINPACFNTMSVPLYASINSTYMAQLPATVRGIISVWATKNLGATVGYESHYSALDKLDLVITLSEGYYRIEDKLSLYIRFFAGMKNMSATITGILRSYDLPAAIYGDPIAGYNFGNVPARHKAITTKAGGILESFQTVEFSFVDIVQDYFYVSGSQELYKLDKLDTWVLSLKSYYPANNLLRYKRRLHKATRMYSLTKFDNIDEAVKHHIHYVITDFNSDLNASINITGEERRLYASINGMDREYKDLTSKIVAV